MAALKINHVWSTKHVALDDLIILKDTRCEHFHKLFQRYFLS